MSQLSKISEESNLPTSSRPLTEVFFGLVFVLRARKDDDDHCVYASVFAKKPPTVNQEKKPKETLMIFSRSIRLLSLQK